MAHPKVSLVNWTPDPVETLAVIWESSKNENPLLTLEDVKKEGFKTAEGFTAEELFWKVLKQRIPIGEHLNFVFVLENVSVSFREQMVRHRIGTSVGGNFGVDIVPDVASSSWWSQSMRIQDMGKFADQEQYRLPPSLNGKFVETAPEHPTMQSAETLFRNTMDAIQDAYKRLVAAGVPMEDARELIPLGAQHRISWAINLQSLLHVMGERGCWILQQGLWGPIITGMVNELATKVHPSFRDLVRPPCIGGDGKFQACKYKLENERRITQDDKHPICPLYLCREFDGFVKMGLKGKQSDTSAVVEQVKSDTGNIPIPRHGDMMARAEDYRALWGHDPFVWDKDLEAK